MDSRVVRRRIAWVALAVAAVGSGGAGAEEPQTRTRPFGLHERNPARFAVDETKRLLALGEHDAAFEHAQLALVEHAASLYLAAQTEESDRWRPVGAVIDELLSGLGPEMAARYEAFVKSRTAPLVAQAAAGDAAALGALRRLYPTTEAGFEALALATDLATERGDFASATALGLEAVRRRREDGAAWWRLGRVLAARGDAERLHRLRPPTGLSVTLAEGPVALDGLWQQWRDAVGAAVPAPGWPTWGGNAARTRHASAGGGRGAGLRWSAPTLLERRERDEPGGFREGDGDDQHDFTQHLESYFPMFPAADARALYVSDGRSLRALDLYGGRMLWALESRTPRLPLLTAESRLLGRTAMDRPFAPTLWRNLVISTLEVERPYVPDWVIQVQINTYMPQRTLVAVDRESGAVVWRAGDHPLDAVRLAGVHLCAEATVEDGVVVAAGARYEHLENVSMFGFDAATGRLRWETPIAYGNQETNLFGNPVKEFSAGAVSARDGTAYSATGLGCLAAVRVHDGRIEWIASYDIEPMQPVQMWFQPRLRIPHFAATAPIVTDELVIVAPGDGLHVSAYRRADGRLAWRSSQSDHPVGATGTLRQVIGTASMGGRQVLLLVGRHVAALDLAHGRVVARGRFDPESSRVRGQGLVRGREVLVPTDQGLQRFSLDGELKLLGRDPWSEDAGPGNLLALGQVLVVAGNPLLQGHYAWEDVERELQRRRRERPRDPEVLLEAGELYLRGRGAAESRAAFQGALDLAEPGSLAALRAKRGLFSAWLAEGDEKARAGERARGAPAWREALKVAQTPAERVIVRMKLDGALGARHDERVKNLEALYEEAGDERAPVEGAGEPLPVRPMTLVRLARLEEEARRGPEAVAALQRLLREHGDVRLGAQTARDVATARIAQVVERLGASAYAPFEEQARRAVEQAREAGDGAALERALAEYPNASVVPAALLALARTRLEAGQPAPAAEAARRLVAAHEGSPESLSALAVLLEAYERLGALGARRAVGAVLAAGPGARRVELADGSTTVAELLERADLGPSAPPECPPLGLPLTERVFDPPADEEITLPVAVTDGDASPSPLALTTRAGTLHAYDLAAGARAWSLEDTTCQRAAWAEGVLLLVLRGELRGVDPTHGTQRWRVPLQRAVHEVLVADGALVLWGQDTGVAGAPRVLEAFDPATGLLLWRRALGHEHGFGLRATAGRLLLFRMQSQAGDGQVRLLAFDLVSGALRRELGLPAARDRGDLALDGRLWLAGEGAAGAGRRVRAIDLATGAEAFTASLASPSHVSAFAVDGPRVYALQQDGTLTTLARATGKVEHVTKVEVGGEARAMPVHGTEIEVRDGALTLLAFPIKSAPPLLCFDATTGKLRWAVEGAPLVQTQVQALARVGGRLAVLLAGRDARNLRRVLLRLVDPASGEVEQEIEPAWGNGGGLVGLATGPGALLVVSGSGTSLYAPGTGEATPERQPPAAR